MLATVSSQTHGGLTALPGPRRWCHHRKHRTALCFFSALSFGPSVLATEGPRAPNLLLNLGPSGLKCSAFWLMSLILFFDIAGL